MSAMPMTRRLAAATLILLGGGAAALADPPGHAGRLSYTEGTVSFHAADQEQWSPATLNFPVTSGNSLWTEPNARTEIQVGAAEIRMDQTTAVDMLRLDDSATQFRVNQGIVNVHLHTVPPGGMQVQTPRGDVNLLQAGSYNVDAGHPNGEAPTEQVKVTVLEGQARVNGPRATLEILPGESAVISGDPVTFTLVEGNATPFDNWALARERREVASETSRYVSPHMTGYQDLDANGRWHTVPTYGPVWYPTAVPVGWAPYRFGHWAFVPPWGWTWVDDAPWGFAPFHYGRWVLIDGVWAWSPGVLVERPVYAPALVAFVGGAHWGVSIAIGANPFVAVGWVPLAPFEVFRPYYPASVAYVRNVNVTSVHATVINNITNVNSVTNNVTVTKFVNQQATTVVPATAFTNAASVRNATLTLPREQLARVPVTENVGHLQPSAAAKAGVAVSAATNLPGPNTSATVANGPVAANTPPTGGTTAAGATSVPQVPVVPKSPGPRINRSAAAPGATGGQGLAHSGPTAPASLPAGPQAKPSSTVAPGPPIAHSGTTTHAATPQPATAAKPPVDNGHAQAGTGAPTAAARHIEQQTQIRPTPQGWSRQPQPPQQAAQPGAQQRGPQPQGVQPSVQSPAHGGGQHSNGPNNQKSKEKKPPGE
ncbi:MAG: hypothetical protein HY246_08475 [Proteobacteria bacterium]|nr:hypothetical protein [Pseudomonadota bacterium]